MSAAGLDSADLISQLRASHAHDAASRQGVDVLTGGMGDMSKLGIFESFKVSPFFLFLFWCRTTKKCEFFWGIK